jgi:modulator of FtsH protease
MANQQFNSAVAPSRASELATNKVLKNTYMLLAATLAFAAVMASAAVAMNFPRLGFIPFLAVFFGLSFLVNKTANSGWGLVSVFLFTGFLGANLGPIINMYMGIPNGPAMVTQAFGLTAFVFLGLSAYVVTTKADMSFMRGFVMAGVMIALGMIAIAVIMSLMGTQVPSFVMLAVSGFFVLLMSALILYQTSEIVHGGETNYIMATTTLFMTIYNLFVSLLSIFGIMGDD